MARSAFYDSPEYRAKQAERTKRNQDKGLYEHLKKQVQRVCARTECAVLFVVQQGSTKQFCSQSCAATINNSGRRLSESVRQKISRSLIGKASPLKGVIYVPRSTAVCANSACAKEFLHEKHRERSFCSIACAMKVVGGKPTSPKASRGKAGIRPDIDPQIYFYSRWEANMARLYSLQGIEWEFEPQTFDIGNQMYTPDFYLPEKDLYIEVKNFWGAYSHARDAKFRKAYPNLKLEVILKYEYLLLEKEYAHFIPNWEYKNSAF